MLSIQSSRSPEYLLSQVVTDYYILGGEPPGYFIGGAKDAFDLPEFATRELVEQFFAGFGPDGAKLVKNAGISLAESERGRRPAWDLTFSAPKSVSVLWGTLPDAPQGRRYRRIIEECHGDAVEFAISYLEHEAGKTRRGKNGTRFESVKLLGAAFRHGSSRCNECQLHDHVLLFNLGLRSDGCGAIHSPFLYKHKMAAGAAYRNKLAQSLRERLGLVIEHDDRSFRIAGVPQAVCDANSTRRKQVKAHLKNLGLASSKAAQLAALATRPDKKHISRNELFQKTREIGIAVKFMPIDSLTLINEKKRTIRPGSEHDVQITVQNAIDFLVKSEAFFAKHEVTRLVMEQLQGSGLDPQEIIAAVNQKLQRGRDIVHLHEFDGIRQYTTTEILQVEGQMLAGMEKLNESSSHGVRKEVIDELLAKTSSLVDEQKKAVEYLLSSGQFKVITGLPGTGKTFVLGICADAWRQQGFHVMGTCLAGRAAVNLQEEAKIRSDTVARLLRHLEQSRLSVLAEYAKAFIDTIRHKPAVPIKRLRLSPQTILVVDEAGMIDTKGFERLRAQVERHGAKLVIVGDDFQLPPIGAGNPFSAAIERFKGVKMIDIRRQENIEDRRGIKDLLNNKTGAFLENLLAHKRLHIASDRNEAIDRLVGDWKKDGGHLEPKKHRIMATTNADCDILNEKCQKERIRTAISLGPTVKIDGKRMYAGDFVMFTERNRLLGVENGQAGFITSIKESCRYIPKKKSHQRDYKITVTTGEKGIQFWLSQYSDMRLAYATSVHKNQGANLQHTRTLLGECQGQQMTYTQESRHVKTSHFYTDKVSAGENLEHLASQIGRSERKLLAHDLLHKDIERPRPDVGRFTPPPEEAVKQPPKLPPNEPARIAPSGTRRNPNTELAQKPVDLAPLTMPKLDFERPVKRLRIYLTETSRENERQLQELSELEYTAKVMRPLAALKDETDRRLAMQRDTPSPIEPPIPTQQMSLSPQLK